MKTRLDTFNGEWIHDVLSCIIISAEKDCLSS